MQQAGCGGLMFSSLAVQGADAAREEGAEAAGQAGQGAQRAGAAGAHAELPAEDRGPDSRVPGKPTRTRSTRSCGGGEPPWPRLPAALPARLGDRVCVCQGILLLFYTP